MNNYPPSENYPPSTPPTQYAQQMQYSGESYSQPQSGYGAPYGSPYGVPPYAPPQAGYAPVNAYGQPVMYAYVPVQINEPGRGQAVAGMVLGIIGICLFWYPILSLPLSIVGLILSILGRRSVTRRGMATAGIVLSSITLVLALSICSLFGFLIAGAL